MVGFSSLRNVLAAFRGKSCLQRILWVWELGNSTLQNESHSFVLLIVAIFLSLVGLQFFLCISVMMFSTSWCCHNTAKVTRVDLAANCCALPGSVAWPAIATSICLGKEGISPFSTPVTIHTHLVEIVQLMAQLAMLSMREAFAEQSMSRLKALTAAAAWNCITVVLPAECLLK